MERPAAACAGCQRRLSGVEVEGEAATFSTLQVREAALLREDYCSPCFSRLREKPVTFWKRAAPAPNDSGSAKPQSRKRRDTDTLVAMFDQLLAPDHVGTEHSGIGSTGDPAAGMEKLRYLLALALVRRRKLELIDMAREGGADRLTLKRNGTAEVVSIVSPAIADEEREKLLLQLQSAL